MAESAVTSDIPTEPPFKKVEGPFIEDGPSTAWPDYFLKGLTHIYANDTPEYSKVQDFLQNRLTNKDILSIIATSRSFQSSKYCIKDDEDADIDCGEIQLFHYWLTHYSGEHEMPSVTKLTVKKLWANYTKYKSYYSLKVGQGLSKMKGALSKIDVYLSQPCYYFPKWQPVGYKPKG